jgi:hypothetical protein
VESATLSLRTPERVIFGISSKMDYFKSIVIGEPFSIFGEQFDFFAIRECGKEIGKKRKLFPSYKNGSNTFG